MKRQPSRCASVHSSPERQGKRTIWPECTENLTYDHSREAVIIVIAIVEVAFHVLVFLEGGIEVGTLGVRLSSWPGQVHRLWRRANEKLSWEVPCSTVRDARFVSENSPDCP